MNITNLKNTIFEILKADERLWDKDKTELNQTLLLDLVDKIDEKIIDLLLQEKDLREKFFVKIKNIYVFKTNDFRFFMEENKVDNSYTAYKNRIGLTDGKKFLKDTDDVVLNFPFKDCVLEGGQSTEEGTDTYFQWQETTYKDKLDDNGEKIKDNKKNVKIIDEEAHYQQKTAKRKEIFFNSVLAHDEIDRLFDAKAFTNWKRFTKDGEQEVKEIRRDKDGNIKENLIIKGNNLLALHSLKKQFAGKVKLIYIDPPYNTRSDGFKYNDNFNHSTWLTFMKNRLEVAKELLSVDGNIIVQSDWNETHYLKVLLDEVFGRENFLNEIIWHYEKWTANSKNLQKNHDNIIVFSKSKGFHKFNIIKEVTENLKEKYEKGYLFGGGGGSEGLVVYDRNKPEVKKLIESGKYKVVYAQNDGKPLSDVWAIPFINPVARERTGFNSQKPEILMERILKIFTDTNDIVLDYHLGSGTTCAVSHKLGRQYIGIEQMDYIETIAVERMKKVIDGEQGGISQSVNWQGGGEFIYFELAKWNETAKEKILDCESLGELIKFFDEMYERYFLNYNLKIKEFREKVIKEEEFKKLSLEEQKKMFVAMLDNNQMYVNKTEMEDTKYGISEKDQKLTSDFYSIEK